MINPIFKIGGTGKWGVKKNRVVSYQKNDNTNLYRAQNLTFSRNSGGVRISQDGVYDWLQNGVNYPRIIWKDNKQCLILENQISNLLDNPVSFDAWATAIGAVPTVTESLKPSIFGERGSIKAWDIIPNTTSGAQQIYEFGLGDGTAGRYSVIAESNGYNYLSLGYSGGRGGSDIIFDLKNGIISTVGFGSYDPRIIDLGNGKYLCSIAFGAGNASVWIIVRNGNTTADFAGDGTSGVTIHHAQLSYGNQWYNTPLVNFQASSSAVTKAKDSLSQGFNDDGYWLPQKEGTIIWRGFITGEGELIQLNRSTAYSIHTWVDDINGTYYIRGGSYNNSTFSPTITTTDCIIEPNTFIEFGYSFKNGEQILVVNGNNQVSTSGVIDNDQIITGIFFNQGGYVMGTGADCFMEGVELYDYAMTTLELQAETTKGSG